MPAAGYNGLVDRCLSTIKTANRIEGACLPSRCGTGWRIGERNVLEPRLQMVFVWPTVLPQYPSHVCTLPMPPGRG